MKQFGSNALFLLLFIVLVASSIGLPPCSKSTFTTKRCKNGSCQKCYYVTNAQTNTVKRHCYSPANPKDRVLTGKSKKQAKKFKKQKLKLPARRRSNAPKKQRRVNKQSKRLKKTIWERKMLRTKYSKARRISKKQVKKWRKKNGKFQKRKQMKMSSIAKKIRKKIPNRKTKPIPSATKKQRKINKSPIRNKPAKKAPKRNTKLLHSVNKLVSNVNRAVTNAKMNKVLKSKAKRAQRPVVVAQQTNSTMLPSVVKQCSLRVAKQPLKEANEDWVSISTCSNNNLKCTPLLSNCRNSNNSLRCHIVGTKCFDPKCRIFRACSLKRNSWLYTCRLRAECPKIERRRTSAKAILRTIHVSFENGKNTGKCGTLAFPCKTLRFIARRNAKRHWYSMLVIKLISNGKKSQFPCTCNEVTFEVPVTLMPFDVSKNVFSADHLNCKNKHSVLNVESNQELIIQNIKITNLKGQSLIATTKNSYFWNARITILNCTFERVEYLMSPLFVAESDIVITGTHFINSGFFNGRLSDTLLSLEHCKFQNSNGMTVNFIDFGNHVELLNVSFIESGNMINFDGFAEMHWKHIQVIAAQKGMVSN